MGGSTGVQVPCGFPRTPALPIKLPAVRGCSLHGHSSIPWLWLPTALWEKPGHFPWEVLMEEERWLLPYACLVRGRDPV